MTLSLRVCFGVMAIGVHFAEPGCSWAQGQMPALWSAEFANSVGVNTHFTQPGTYYATHFEAVKARLLELGARHIRDGVIDDHGDISDRDQSAMFRELGVAGIRADFIFNFGVSRHLVSSFPQRVAPAFEAYELPNEFNLNGGPDWVKKLRSWMPRFREYVHSDPATSRFPIIGPSLVTGFPDPFAALGNRQEDFDFGNIHVYFNAFNPGTRGWGDVGPPPCQTFNYGSIGYTSCLTALVSGSRPIVVTETGWSSEPGDSGGITPDLQSRYIARLLLLLFNRGVSRTYIYQFADGGGDIGRHHGLITSDGAEKPAFLQLRSLLRLTGDRDGTGDAGSLAARLDGDVDHIEKTLLRRSDGSFLLFMWVEQPAQDAGATRPVTLTLTGYLARRVSRLEDDGALTTQQVTASEAGAASRVELKLNDRLTVVDIVPSTP
jgi:hypothetical protein